MNDIEKKIEIKRTRGKLSASVKKLNADRTYYISKAKEALERGDKAAYSLSRSGLSNTLIQLKRTREMLLNIDITSQMRDTSLVTQDFLKNIGKIFKDISKVNKHLNLKKTRAQLRAAMTSVESMNNGLEVLLSSADCGFNALTDGGIADEELDRLISGKATADEQLMGEKLDSLLTGIEEQV